MYPLVLFILSLLFSGFTWANKEYQIDLILFAHATPVSELALDGPLIDLTEKALTLSPDPTKSGRPFKLLAHSYSSLNDAYYQLTHKPAYQVLGYYSWRQPLMSQTKVALPVINHNGWQLQGTISVIQNTYYTFNANLRASPPSKPESSLALIQKQRLKENVVYYLDHTHLGMLVKIHKV